MEGASMLSSPAASRMLAVVDDEGCCGELVSGRCSSFYGCSPSAGSSSSSMGSNSSFRGSPSSSSDFLDDATSPSERPSPLCEIATLMADLPIKRSLSRHFQGKSQSFMSLAAVASVEDLVKPDLGLWCQRSTVRRRTVVRACKSKTYAVGLDDPHPTPISPNGWAISKLKKHYSCLARRNIAGGGGGTGFSGAAAAGVHDHHQKHGSAAGGCLRPHQQHALLFAR